MLRTLRASLSHGNDARIVALLCQKRAAPMANALIRGFQVRRRVTYHRCLRPPDLAHRNTAFLEAYEAGVSRALASGIVRTSADTSAVPARALPDSAGHRIEHLLNRQCVHYKDVRRFQYHH